MTLSTQLSVSNVDLTLEIVTHDPQFPDYLVANTHTAQPLGRVWEYDGRWRARVEGDSRFVEVERVTDALEVLVRMSKTESALPRQATQHFEGQPTWVADGGWHSLDEPVVATGFLQAMLRHACPSMTVDPIDHSKPLPEGVDVYTWESGHNPFSLMVRWVDVWTWYDGEVVWSDTKQTNVDPDGKPVRRIPPERGARPGAFKWERKMGQTPFLIGYRLEAC